MCPYNSTDIYNPNAVFCFQLYHLFSSVFIVLRNVLSPRVPIP